ncbi:hypothetical protein D030_3061B, partial [Vibrio parahaemolyticus AQ3810]
RTIFRSFVLKGTLASPFVKYCVFYLSIRHCASAQHSYLFDIHISSDIVWTIS